MLSPTVKFGFDGIVTLTFPPDEFIAEIEKDSSTDAYTLTTVTADQAKLDDILAQDITDFKVGDCIWVGFEGDNWNVYRYTESNVKVLNVTYDSSNKDLVEQYLTVNRNTNTVLLHESINDDLRDHTDGARWLGEALTLKLDIFNE